MKFRSFSRLFGNWWSKNEDSQNRRFRKKSPRLSIEHLEDRTLLSVLPAPVVTNQSTLPGLVTTGLFDAVNPQEAMDPVNPQKIVVAASIEGGIGARAGIGVWYSIDAGYSWNVATFGQPVTVANINDPNLASGNAYA